MLTLDGMTGPAPADIIEALTAAVAQAGQRVGAYSENEKNRPPQSIVNRRASRESIGRELEACGDAGAAMLHDAAEFRMFVAKRRLLLAQYGFDDSPFPSMVTLKAQPERLGVLLIVTFLDRLACVDPKRWYDAIFLPEAETMEIWWHFYAPKAGVKRWLARRKAEGRPWEPNSGSDYIEGLVTREDFKRVRAVLYPTKEAKDAASARRYLTPAEAHEAYRAALAEINGEPPHAISTLMKLDVDSMTPVEALSTLKRLQDVALRRDVGPRLFGGP
ncbi:hypothetical protein G6L67_11790 [Agrobacterium tumefaciens]|jgi:hypothetical protein|uniref:Uncharacterized protein n=1 Tax=Agrobacterium tumefaciens str. Kerr 14 TaxID=1183424 RepID=A0A1S7P164_AGRTU|nr:hypothetical protein [Agrobacterium tumefaciens]AYM81854.1 hypothetical protein At12D1_19670 [Agrobacterium tumefaciens]NTE92532.1 hypothetical protein [Agrobacterium tumefaciens]CUX14127.1 hypothetical protein AGR4C_Cc150039 [Agrobacterium tumefaciens str. Kerr 14]